MCHYKQIYMFNLVYTKNIADSYDHLKGHLAAILTKQIICFRN